MLFSDYLYAVFCAGNGLIPYSTQFHVKQTHIRELPRGKIQEANQPARSVQQAMTGLFRARVWRKPRLLSLFQQSTVPN